MRPAAAAAARAQRSRRLVFMGKDAKPLALSGANLDEMRALFHAAGLDPSPEDWAFFERLRLTVIAGNASMNLTRITEQREFFLKHVLDSALPLVAVPALRGLGEGLLAADVGSGAGFPGLVIARLRPSWDVALLERTRKKANFLEEAAEALGLENTFVVPLDAAEAPSQVPVLRRRCDLVLARAVGRIGAVTRSAKDLVRAGGWIVHYKGGEPPPDELEEGRREVKRLGFLMEEPAVYALPPEARRSVVLVVNPPSGPMRDAGAGRSRAKRGIRRGRGR